MTAGAIGEPRPCHGLTELAKRQGWRRLAHTERNGAYLSERTVFRDTATGCVAWRMTCDPAVDTNDYYDIPGWNADGSVMGFLTRRTGGGRKRWLMDADGANLRPMPIPDGVPVGRGWYWSIRHRNRFYHMLKDGEGTHVVSMDPFTGERETIVSVDRDLGDMMPPHPSEEYFLFGDRTGAPRPGEAGAPSVAYVVALDGSVQEVHFEKRWHRLRFTKSADRRLFFNFDDPRTQWTILPDGSDRQNIPHSGGHPDWPMDGSELTYYADGCIWGIRYDGTDRRCVIDLESGGHGGPCMDGEWFVSDTPNRGRYPGSILNLRTDGSGVCYTMFKHMSSLYSHDVLWHPDHHSTHPHPNSSPDGTKTIFNSDFLGQYSDIYIVVNRLPDAPCNLTVRTEGTDAVLNWQEPAQCRETRGYLVYHSEAPDAGYRCLTDKPVQDMAWRGPSDGEPGCYTVTALEWSGLESEPCPAVRRLGGGESAPVPERIEVFDTTAPDTPSDVRVEALSPNALRISWAAIGAPNLDHYNVYCGRDADVSCEQASLVGSPSEAEFVDWGLALNTTYWYRVSAVDRAGNASAPSAAVQGCTPAFEPVRIELKAEGAEVVDMASTEVAGGKALQAAGEGARATWTFELPRDTEVAIWGRSTHREGEPSAFDLTIDGEMEIAWQVWGRWDAWHWSPAGKMVTGSPEIFTLKAGTHTLQAKAGTPTSPVAEIVITDDPTWWPVEGMKE